VGHQASDQNQRERQKASEQKSMSWQSKGMIHISEEQWAAAMAIQNKIAVEPDNEQDAIQPGIKCHLCGKPIRHKKETQSCQDCNITYFVCKECEQNETGFMCDCGGEVMVQIDDGTA
jgi:hypothetical protein